MNDEGNTSSMNTHKRWMSMMVALALPYQVGCFNLFPSRRSLGNPQGPLPWPQHGNNLIILNFPRRGVDRITWIYMASHWVALNMPNAVRSCSASRGELWCISGGHTQVFSRLKYYALRSPRGGLIEVLRVVRDVFLVMACHCHGGFSLFTGFLLSLHSVRLLIQFPGLIRCITIVRP